MSTVRRRVTARASQSLGVLAILAVLYTCYLAQSLIIPFAVALLARFILMPAVRRLERLRLPQWLASLIVLTLAVSLLVFAVSIISAPARQLITEAPAKMRLLEQQVKSWKRSIAPVATTAHELEKLTLGTQQPAQQVAVSGPTMLESFYDTGQTFLASTVVGFVLLFFLLLYGDELFDNLGAFLSATNKQNFADAFAKDVELAVSRYLSTIALINLTLGTCVGIAMHFLEMPNPAFWGITAGLLEFIPYIGPLTMVCLIGLTSIVTFPTASDALLPPAAYFAITSLESVITPSIVGQRFKLNPLIVFAWLLLWGWLWGAVGALIAVPFLVAARIVFDRLHAGGSLIVLLTDVHAPLPVIVQTSPGQIIVPATQGDTTATSL